MTTTIKVTSHNYPALIETWDQQYDAEKGEMKPDSVKTSEVVVNTTDGEHVIYCTTTRKIVITDLEYDDPRATKP